jgi:hypothetical protein
VLAPASESAVDWRREKGGFDIDQFWVEGSLNEPNGHQSAANLP